MSRYRVTWTETWSRSAEVDIDETDVREYLQVPVGPLSEVELVDYLDDQEHGEMYEWHPGTCPNHISYDDEFADLGVDGVGPPTGEST